MANWLEGYSSTFRAMRVDAETWQDSAPIPGVTSMSVSRDCTADVPLIEAGQVELDADGFETGWLRLYMNVDGSESVAVATMLFERISRRVELGSTVALRGRSVLQPAADIRMPYGSFAPAGSDGAQFAAGLMRECTPAPVSVEGSFTLVEDLVFDIGCSYLEAVWQVLGAADWCMRIAGDGTITVSEKPTEPALELSRANAGLLIPGVDDEFSIADIPNRYYAVNDTETAVAVNEDPSSEASHARRGRWVDVVDTAPVLVNGETLEMYAERKLEEATIVTRTYTYDREFWPGVVPFDMVRASLPDHGVEGVLRVMSQSLTCGNGITVNEKAGREVRA